MLPYVSEHDYTIESSLQLVLMREAVSPETPEQSNPETTGCI